MFPIEVEITQEIINGAQLHNITNCIGARAVKSVIPNARIEWGVTAGDLFSSEGESIEIYSVSKDGECIDMTAIESPMTIVLTDVKPSDYHDYRGVNTFFKYD